MCKTPARTGIILTLCAALAPALSWGQSDPAASASTPPATGETAAPSADFKPEELEQLAAPIALYPDSLISQILMASTYPLEVVQADRFAQQNKDLQGDALTDALEKEDWDPSVKSLVNFPQVLSMMSEKLDWTSQLGDAFLAQQKGLMDAIQKLRARAKSEGNLESTPQQTVVVKEEASTQVIVVEAADPEVVYVPSYNPTVVYGSWPYPAYPPHYYYPPGYVATAAVSFGVGMACGAAWGYAWGGCNWGHGDIDIDCDRNLRINNNIDRSRYKNDFSNRNNNIRDGRGSWQHDPSHRKGASYRDQGTARRYGGQSATDAARSRDAFRGRAEAGRQDIARGGADQYRGQSRPGTTQRAGTASRPQSTSRGPSADRSRPSQTSRQSYGSRSSALDGTGQGNRARADSQRGQSSRQQASRSSSSRSGSGRSSSYSRGGGSSRSSGMRGGGGSRGGGGRGGRR